MKKTEFNLWCLLMIVILGSCGAIGSTVTFHNSDKWLPAKFRPAKAVLLVEVFAKPQNRANKAMAIYLDKNYPYKYEIVSADNINDLSGKYADLNTYPYALVWSRHTLTSIGSNGSTRSGGTGYDLNFYDREKEKNYPKTGKGCTSPMMLFKPVINTIVKYCHKG